MRFGILRRAPNLASARFRDCADRTYRLCLVNTRAALLMEGKDGQGHRRRFEGYAVRKLIAGPTVLICDASSCATKSLASSMMPRAHPC
jgi:hypothetical protein